MSVMNRVDTKKNDPFASINVAYSDFSSLEISDVEMEKLIGILPHNRAIQLEKRKFKTAGLLCSLLGYYCLLHPANGLVFIPATKLVSRAPELRELISQVGWHVGDSCESGKPFPRGISYNKRVKHISFTHSNKLACVALSDNPVGIDAETFAKNEEGNYHNTMKIANRFFEKTEIERVNLAQNKVCEFYKIWTEKESVIKLDGRGIKILKEFSVDSYQKFNLFNRSGEVKSWIVETDKEKSFITVAAYTGL